MNNFAACDYDDDDDDDDDDDANAATGHGRPFDVSERIRVIMLIL